MWARIDCFAALWHSHITFFLANIYSFIRFFLVSRIVSFRSIRQNQCRRSRWSFNFVGLGGDVSNSTGSVPSLCFANEDLQQNLSIFKTQPRTRSNKQPWPHGKKLIETICMYCITTERFLWLQLRSNKTIATRRWYQE